MSDDEHAEQTATTETAETVQAVADEVAEGSPVPEATVDSDVADAPAEEPVAEAVDEAEADADEPVVIDAPVDEPVVEADEPIADEPAVVDAPVDEPVAEGPVEEEAPATVSEAFGPVRVARVYVCERGHRTTTLWGDPDTCLAQPLRHGPNCGLKLYHITELPEQVQKALNPLKASKKSSKKK
jgi:hypothetical protein